MMSIKPIGLEHLWLPTLTVGAFGFFMCVRYLKLNVVTAGVLTIIKLSIPFIYFAFYYDGIIQFDDYLGRVELWFSKDDNPFGIFLNKELMFALFGRPLNILYIWWNFLATWLYGNFYSSPVMMNVGLTFLGAVFVDRLATLAGFSRRYAQLLAIVYLLHWDTVVWSSFPNLKEIAVQVMTLGAWYGLLLFKDGKSNKKALLISISTLAVLTFLRYYLTPVIAGLFAMFLVFSQKNKKNTFFFVLLAGSAALVMVVSPLLRLFISKLSADFPLQVFQFLLSPQPWALSDKNFWQLHSATFHLMFFVPACIGVLALLKNATYRYFLIYFLVILTLYALGGRAEQRHRLQVSWVIIWAQFHFVWLLLKSIISLDPKKSKEHDLESQRVLEPELSP